MTRTIVDTPVSARTRAAIRRGWDLYKASTEEHGPSDEWNRKVIDHVIRHLVKQGHPFSANTMRPFLPEVRKCLISRRLIAAQKDGLITYIGVTASTLESTKSARVNVYEPHPEALDG